MLPHEADARDKKYVERIDASVVDSLTSGARTLAEVCQRCEGAFPPLVLDSLKRMELLGRLEVSGHVARQRDALADMLPDAHPLDYEWRFTIETAELIARESLAFGTNICCAGTPSVFAALKRIGRSSLLVDSNPAVAALESTPAFLVRTISIFDDSLRSLDGKFEVVVVDPPWYYDASLAWLARSCRLIQPNGHVVLSLFPRLVRPNATIEHDALIDVLRPLGDVIRLAQGTVVYSTPRFEAETLEVLGIEPLQAWRTGDLVIFRPGSDTVHELSNFNDVSHNNWHRIRLGKQVVAHRLVAGEHPSWQGALRLAPPNEDGTFVLKSVSSRDPARRDLSLWTSRNRAARVVSGLKHLSEFLKALERGVRPSAAIDRFPSDSHSDLLTVVSLLGL